MSDLVERRGRWPAVVLCGWRGHQWDVKGITGEFEWCRRCGMRRMSPSFRRQREDALVDEMLERAGRDEVFALVRANGWSPADAPPHWVWLEACAEVMKRRETVTQSVKPAEPPADAG